VSATRVLVVDDEQQILRALRTSLRAAGYDVDTADTAESALAQAAMRPPEAVILDLVLPDGTGTDVTSELRKWTSAPVIVLSAVDDEREKVQALDAGADDYVTKPVGIDELLARLRAALRRTTTSAEPVIELDDLVVDLQKRSVSVGGAPVHLTPHEFDLLRVLAINEGKLMTHRMLLQEVWGPAYVGESNLLHVKRVAAATEDRARPRPAALSPDGAGRRLSPGQPGRAPVLETFRFSADEPQGRSGGLQRRSRTVKTCLFYRVSLSGIVLLRARSRRSTSSGVLSASSACASYASGATRTACCADPAAPRSRRRSRGESPS
jgi:two-component system, OmpR family, KDP operon response regulator KdpE